MLRALAERLTRKLCVALSRRLPLREITRGATMEPYLDRYYLFGKAPEHFPPAGKCKKCGKTVQGYRIFIDDVADAICNRDGYHELSFPERLGFLPTVFLHHFRDSDQEDELHNHPWEDSLSLILVGGYREERVTASFGPNPLMGESAKTACQPVESDEIVMTRLVRPFSINRITADDFHRVSLIGNDAWTIFITGEKKQSWGFLSKNKSVYIPWRAYRHWKERVEMSS